MLWQRIIHRHRANYPITVYPSYRISATVIALVLFGGTVVAFLLSPALERLVQTLHRSSKSGAGSLGEALFLIGLGALVFWLYYQMTINGIASLLPVEWRNSPLS